MATRLRKPCERFSQVLIVIRNESTFAFDLRVRRQQTLILLNCYDNSRINDKRLINEITRLSFLVDSLSKSKSSQLSEMRFNFRTLVGLLGSVDLPLDFFKFVSDDT